MCLVYDSPANFDFYRLLSLALRYSASSGQSIRYVNFNVLSTCPLATMNRLNASHCDSPTSTLPKPRFILFISARRLSQAPFLADVLVTCKSPLLATKMDLT
jgi:hypothetical protein